MAEEIELKLSIAAAAGPRIWRHPAVVAARSGRARTTLLHSTYYDTPASDLRTAGVAVRLRRAGRRWLQTAKGAGQTAAGLHTRSEYEWPLPGPRLDAARLATTPWRKLFAASAGRLRPVFTTEFRRTELPLAFADGTRALLCLDVGAIRAGRRRRALCEVEIELASGDAAPLFEFAQALAADLPLTVEHDSKAEHGYALARSAAAVPVRAKTLPLDPASSTPAALSAIAGDCLAQIGGNAAGVIAAADPEFLHQLRVGLRRLRSLIRLCADLLPPERLAPVAAGMRWLAEALGPGRDWDVFVGEMLPPIIAEFAGTDDKSALARLRARAMRQRRKHQVVARTAVASMRFQRLVLALGGIFAGLARATLAGAPPVATFAAELLARRDRRLRKRAKGLKHATPEERHAVRIAAKKLRYAAEFFAPLFPAKRTKGYIAALSKLQRVLGAINDLATAERLLAHLVATPGARPPEAAHASGLVRGWIRGATLPELKRLAAAWRAFDQCKPFWN